MNKYKNILFNISLTLLSIFYSIPLFSEIEIPQAVIKILSFSQASSHIIPWHTYPVSESWGSGFVIEGNIILTNAHVVRYAKYIEVTKQDNPKRYIAQIKFISHSLDLAMLSIDDTTFFDDIEPFKLGPIPKLDTKVKTIGFPMGGEKISITTGIISRIEKQLYSHTGVDEHLAIQTDAAINPGNSGGPVIQDGKVVGMAFQGIKAGDNIGYMIPTTVINHFIEDALDNKINGIPEMGIYFNQLPPIMRTYYNLTKEQTGILIIWTHPFSPANDIFKKNDIITSINEYQIFDDGSIKLKNFKVMFYEILERSQYGDEVNFTILRDGLKKSIKIKLKPFIRPLDIGSSYDPTPPYFLFSGLTFVKLSGDYMRSFDSDWWENIPHFQRYLYYYQSFFNKEEKRKHFIVLSEVFQDSHNSHARFYKNHILESINGKNIYSLNEIKPLIEKIDSEFYIFKFFKNPIPLVLNRKQAKSMHKKILSDYNIKTPYKLEKN